MIGRERAGKRGIEREGEREREIERGRARERLYIDRFGNLEPLGDEVSDIQIEPACYECFVSLHRSARCSASLRARRIGSLASTCQWPGLQWKRATASLDGRLF